MILILERVWTYHIRYRYPSGMQCGHDFCRHCWAVEGVYSWYSRNWDSPVPCLSPYSTSLPCATTFYPPQFVPCQPATVYLKKLNPDKTKHSIEHVATSLGDEARGMSIAQLQQKIVEFNEEVDTVINWAYQEVKKRMLVAAARVDLRVDLVHKKRAPVTTFDDIKTSWKWDGTAENIGKIYKICHGDYEGKRNQQWSRTLEIDYMHGVNIAYDTEPSLREKGGYEQCITHAKGTLVRQIMARSATTHKGKIVLSLKGSPTNGLARKNHKNNEANRRKEGDFFFKTEVSRQQHIIEYIRVGRKGRGAF